MPRTIKKSVLFLLCLSFSCLHLYAQRENLLNMVNPAIGTTQTKIHTLWGGEGGTYPGAVAPFGFMQLTPETQVAEPGGYDYKDSTIYYFSCTHHLSGYPNGSSGNIQVMPVLENLEFQAGNYHQNFSYQDEKAEPGYYRVCFKDNNTLVEVTASEHAGMFRFTFPAHSRPRIFLGDMGTIEVRSKRIIEGSKLHTVVLLSKDFTEKEDVTGGCLLTFPSVGNGKNQLTLKIGASETDLKSTYKNLQSEADTWNFDQYQKANQQKWMKALSVIEIEDTSIVNKTIFYTALYHSFLVPWIISDVEGFYRGADGLIHQSRGKNQYGAFSAWDTFRTLHPLLCLIAPDRQNDMIQSMLDQYVQSGKLPKGPMTGNHVIPIIVDSYLKGISNFDRSLAYKAMKSSLTPSNNSDDFLAYRDLGYVPLSYSESVTRTVEYAYDDWVLAQFAGKVMNDREEYKTLLKRSFNYRNLFDPETLFLLPRQGVNFIPEPGNFGYKEGDKWSYSLFVPHNPVDLVNLMGGNQEFASRLDSALARQDIIFDNEPVLQVPYLFNYAQRPDQTQLWVRNMMQTRYSASADGLPGNDDLGSLSSWYVFSAMGFFPLCPGSPSYDFGSPLFKKVTLHLQNGKKFIINAENNSEDHCFFKKITLNNLDYNKLQITHSAITEGGELKFSMCKLTENPTSVVTIPSEMEKFPDFRISNFHLSRKQVKPDQSFYACFLVQNNGSRGTKIIRLFANGKEYKHKNILIEENSMVSDSIECRLYAIGRSVIAIENQKENIEVVPPLNAAVSRLEVTALTCRTVGKINERMEFSYLVMNKSGYLRTDTLSVLLDDSVRQKLILTLEPGEIRKVSSLLTIKKIGIHLLKVGPKSEKIKIYAKNRDSKILDISTNGKLEGDTITDRSGLSNNGIVKKVVTTNHLSGLILNDSVNFIEFNHSKSLDDLNHQITIMGWVYPTKQKGISDIITKGDHIVIQTHGNTRISFFAGGWGRGSCSANLPDNWLYNWHHITGVCDGNSLKLYIDGKESGSQMVASPANLNTAACWMIGRNEEFPDQRFFHGLIDEVKIFAEPLTDPEINKEMQERNPSFKH